MENGRIFLNNLFKINKVKQCNRNEECLNGLIGRLHMAKARITEFDLQ